MLADQNVSSGVSEGSHEASQDYKAPKISGQTNVVCFCFSLSNWSDVFRLKCFRIHIVSMVSKGAFTPGNWDPKVQFVSYDPYRTEST